MKINFSNHKDRGNKEENKQYKQNTQSFSDSLAYIMVNVNFISDTAKWLCDPKAPVCLNKQIKT